MKRCFYLFICILLPICTQAGNVLHYAILHGQSDSTTSYKVKYGTSSYIGLQLTDGYASVLMYADWQQSASFPKDYSIGPSYCSTASYPVTSYTRWGFFSLNSGLNAEGITTPNDETQAWIEDDQTIWLGEDDTYRIYHYFYVEGVSPPSDPDTDPIPNEVTYSYTIDYQIFGITNAYNEKCYVTTYRKDSDGTDHMIYDRYWMWPSHATYSASDSIIKDENDLLVPASIHLVMEDSWGTVLSNIEASFVPDGNNYIAELSGSYSYSGSGEELEPVDPELPTLPINPIDPPDPIGDMLPDPDSPGGDTNPNVASNYYAFKEAMEGALDSRELSGEEIEDANRSALSSLGLTSTNLGYQFEMALSRQAVDMENVRNATQDALARQGLSGSNIGANNARAMSQVLSTYNLSGEKIGKAVGDQLEPGLDSLGDKIDGLGETIDGLGDGDGSYNSETTVPDGSELDEEVQTATDTINEIKPSHLQNFATLAQERLRNMFTIDFPTLGQQTYIGFDLPALSIGSVSIDLPELSIDLEDLEFVYVLRHILVITVSIWFFRQCMHIFNTTFQ